MDIQTPQLLTDEDVARILGIQRKTLAQWRSDGVGPPFVRLGGHGGRIRYDLEDLKKWIEEGRVANSEGADTSVQRQYRR